MTMSPVLRRAAYWTLVAAAAFNALSAVGGGVVMILTEGAGLPASILIGSPFTSFIVPGLILAIVVGGTQSLAAVLMLRRRESALLWAAVAGVGMLIWVFVEIGIVGGGAWLQAVYFGTGLLQVILVLSLLGVVGWLPRRNLGDFGLTGGRDAKVHAPIAGGQATDSPTA